MSETKPVWEKFEVRNAEAEKMLKEIGGLLREACPPGIGFALLVFPFGEGGGMFYASNADRQDIVNTMREFIQKFEGN